MKILSELKYDRDGLVAAVIQDCTNNEILMVGYMNAEAIKETLTYWACLLLESFPSKTLDKGGDFRAYTDSRVCGSRL